MIKRKEAIERMAKAIYLPDEECDIIRGMVLSYDDSPTKELVIRQAEAALNALLDYLPNAKEKLSIDLGVLTDATVNNSIVLYQELKSWGK